MVRLLVAIVLGAAVVFGLFFMMQALIASGQSAITERETIRIVDFVRVQREETIESKRSKPRRPPNPDEAPPDAPQPAVADTVDSGAEAIGVGAMESSLAGAGDLGFDIGTIGFGVADGSADGDYIPLVRVAPIYPRRAAERGIEGWVILELTVTETGAVKNPRIVSFHPSEIFNKAAMNAALKFKYKPRVVNGKPIEVRGVRYKLTFELVD